MATFCTSLCKIICPLKSSSLYLGWSYKQILVVHGEIVLICIKPGPLHHLLSHSLWDISHSYNQNSLGQNEGVPNQPSQESCGPAQPLVMWLWAGHWNASDIKLLICNVGLEILNGQSCYEKQMTVFLKTSYNFPNPAQIWETMLLQMITLFNLIPLWHWHKAIMETQQTIKQNFKSTEGHPIIGYLVDSRQNYHIQDRVAFWRAVSHVRDRLTT